MTNKDYSKLFSYNYLKLFATFFLYTIILAALQSPQIVSQLEAIKTAQKKSDPSSPDIRKTAMLEIFGGSDGQPRYKLRIPQGQSMETTDANSMLAAIKKAAPVDLILRADRRMTIGDVDSVILPVQQSGVTIYRSNDPIK